MVAGTKQKLIIKVLAAITVHIYGGGVISNFYFLLPILFSNTKKRKFTS